MRRCVAIVLLLTACRLEVSYDGTRYRCDTEACPSGFSCVAGECLPEGFDPGADAAPAPDARPDDVPVPDARVPDANAPPDAAIADASPPPCEGGDTHLLDPTTGHCYLYFAAPVTWEAAASACAALVPTAHLVTVADAAENALITPLPVMVPDVWIGGTDAAVEMTFLWITGEPMTYTNWRAGEPNDDVGGEDCAVLEADTALGTWDDRDCLALYPTICERY